LTEAMPRKPMHLAAMVAAGVVVLTGAHALRQSWAREAPRSPDVAATSEAAEAVDPGRHCAIYHARFGGSRARLLKVMRGDVANYVVIEVSRGNRVVPSVQRAWLRGAYGDAEPVWLGEFASPDSALAKAARLCPDTARCRRGEPNCGPDEGPFSALPAL
jgi:hypothetical protein